MKPQTSLIGVLMTAFVLLVAAACVPPDSTANEQAGDEGSGSAQIADDGTVAEDADPASACPKWNPDCRDEERENLAAACAKDNPDCEMPEMETEADAKGSGQDCSKHEADC